MKVILYLEDKMAEYKLPDQISGNFAFGDQASKLINIKAKDNRWYLCSTNDVTLLENGVLKEEVELKDYQFYRLKQNNNLYTVSVGPTYEDTFQMFSYNEESNLFVGKNNLCNVIYQNEKVGDNFFHIYFENQKAFLEANKDSLLYLNSKRVKDEKVLLKDGDTIEFYGLRFVLYPNFLFMNNPLNQVLVNENLAKIFNIDNTQEKKTEIERKPIAEKIMKEASIESDYGSMKRFYDVIKKMKESKDEISVKIAENIDHLLNASNISSLNFKKTEQFTGTKFSNYDSVSYGNGSFIFDEFGTSQRIYTHEVGHLLNNFNGIKIPEEFEEVSRKMVENLNTNTEEISGFLNHVKDYKRKFVLESLKKAQDSVNNLPKEEIDLFVNKCLSSTNPSLEISINAKEAGFSQSKIDDLLKEMKNGITEDVKYQIGRIYKVNLANILLQIDELNDHEMMQYDIITCIIDSIYNGKNPYYYRLYAPNAMRSHKPECFQKKQTNGFDEQFADYVSLRVNADVYQPAINYLKGILGNEWFEMMDKRYREISTEIEKTNTKLDPIEKDETHKKIV